MLTIAVLFSSIFIITSMGNHCAETTKKLEKYENQNKDHYENFKKVS